MLARGSKALRFGIGLTLVIAAAELVVMQALKLFSALPPGLAAVIDALLLAVLISPAIYLLLYRPLYRQLTERQAAELRLKSALDEQAHLNQQLSQAREQLLESEKLVSMGQIAAGVAHEINNPVGYIGSNLSTLADYCDGVVRLLAAYEACHELIETDTSRFQQVLRAREQADVEYLKADIEDLISESRDGIERVKRIVQDLKDFSRSDDGVLEAVDLNAELERALNIAHNQLKYHTTLTKHYTEPLPLVRCVPSQIDQVLLNILVNAGQAIENQGTITLSTQVFADEVCVSIADSGCGMSEELRLRIFEPFYTTKPRGKGTGLGLSVSWGIVKKHGGRIEVTSELGKGSEFRVYLPLVPPAECSEIAATE